MVKFIGFLILVHAAGWLVGFDLLSAAPGLGLVVMAMPTVICIGITIWGLARL